MRARKYFKLSLVIACFSLLVQCTAIDPNQLGGRPLGSPYTMPAEAYIALANNHMGEEKQALLLLAAGRWVDEGRWQDANSILAQIKPASSVQADKKNLLFWPALLCQLHSEKQKQVISWLSCS